MVTDSKGLLGQALGTCTLQRLLGQGGMGVVYLAQQSRPRRTVAVKVLVPGILIEEKSRTEFITRFRREADAIAALDHINIVPIYEYGEQADLAYLVMPYLTGGTLRDRLAQQQALPLSETLRIIEQAASALDLAHSQGIIHRDLKPGNILFHADGRVLLADFGLAKVIKDAADNDRDIQSALTSAGTIIGTPEYLSPEQGTGEPIGPYTDTYSLGIVLYQMLTGRVPFTGTSPVSIAIKHTLELPTPPSQLNPSISSAVEAVVLKAISKRPEQRYASAGELAQALRAATEMNAETLITGVRAPLTHVADYETMPEHTHQATAGEKSTTQVPDIRQVPIQQAPQILPPPIPGENLHAAKTEEAPRLQQGERVVQSAFPTPTTAPPQPPAPMVSPPPRQVAAQPEPVKVTLQQLDGSPNKRRGGCQSLTMMLIGSILTLVLLIGGFAAYLQFVPPTNKNRNVQTTTTPDATTTPPIQKSNQPDKLPAASIAAGQLIYGTAHPGATCDNQGASWIKQETLSIKCNPTNVQLKSADAGRITTTFLSQLPKKKTLPDNYILQIQYDTQSFTQGELSIFYRSTSNDSPDLLAFQINPAGHWRGITYSATTQATHEFYAHDLQGQLQGTTTIAISVSGNYHQLYINGIPQGHTETDAYPMARVGLGVGPGTTINIKNLAVYNFPGY